MTYKGQKRLEPWDESDGCWFLFALLWGGAMLVGVAILGFTGLVIWELVQWLTSK